EFGKCLKDQDESFQTRILFEKLGQRFELLQRHAVDNCDNKYKDSKNPILCLILCLFINLFFFERKRKKKKEEEEEEELNLQFQRKLIELFDEGRNCVEFLKEAII